MKRALYEFYSRTRRSVFEAFGSSKYSFLGHDGLDRRIVELLNGKRGGFFVEAGANDGLTQNNSYVLERMFDWNGLLIEPVPELAQRCRANRPSAKTVESALVAPDQKGKEVKMFWSHQMSTTDFAFGSREKAKSHAELGHSLQSGIAPISEISVRGSTLDQVLQDASAPKHIDLLILDLEGSEVEALKGLSLSRWDIDCICIEAWNEAAIQQALGPVYGSPRCLSERGSSRDLFYSKSR